VQLRQAPLFTESIRWCSNLSAPDMLYDWSWLMPRTVNDGIGIFGLGPYFNVLPLVTVALFLVSQKMFMPEPANEQAAMQQTIMEYMTLFMGLLFYKVAAGLCIYFITSSLWGIAERKLLPKFSPADAELASPAAASSSAIPRSKGLEARSGRNGSDGQKSRPKVPRRK
jgi:YidC/Oxa1 family membrane protein insertase